MNFKKLLIVVLLLSPAALRADTGDIPLSSNFEESSSRPLDGRIRAANSTERLALTSVQAYDGLQCYQVDNQHTYQLQGSTSNWVDLGILSMNSGSNLLPSTNTWTGGNVFTTTTTMAHAVVNQNLCVGKAIYTGGQFITNETGSLDASTLINPLPAINGAALIALNPQSLNGQFNSIYAGSPEVMNEGAGISLWRQPELNSTYIGTDSGFNAVSSSVFNTCVGGACMSQFNPTGGFDSCLGNACEGNITTANACTSLGYASQFGLTSGSSDNSIGMGSMQTGGVASYDNVMGQYALYSSTDVNYSDCVGHTCMFNSVHGASYNDCIGAACLYSNTTGLLNFSGGYQSLKANTVGIENACTGANCELANTTASGNDCDGYACLVSNTSGANNWCGGIECLFNLNGGYENACGGETCLFSLTTGHDNSSIGPQGLYGVTTGVGNVGMGQLTGYNVGGSTIVTSGSYSTFIGFGSGWSGSGQPWNSLALGANSQVNCSSCAVFGGPVGSGNEVNTIVTTLTVNASMFGAGLSSCSGSSNALGFTSTGTFTCQTIAGGSGGSSSLKIAAGVTSSSPTSDAIFPASQFVGAVSGSTITVTLNSSSVTLQGNAYSISGIAASTGILTTQMIAVGVSTGAIAVSTTTLENQINTKVNLASFTATLPIAYNNTTGVFSASLISLSTGVVGILAPANMVSTVAYTTANQTWTAPQTFASSITNTSPLGESVTYNMNIGSMTGAGLSSCNSASNALTWSSTSNQFGCNTISGGSGGSSLEVIVYGVAETSPTKTISLSTNSFTGYSLNSGNTFYADLGPTLHNIETASSSWTFISSVTALSVQLTGPGNFSFTNSADGQQYQTVGSSATVVVGDVAVWGASNTIVDGGAKGGGGTPGGSNQQLQYNNSSAFGGAANTSVTSSSMTLLEPVQISTVIASGSLIWNTGPPIYNANIVLTSTASVVLASAPIGGLTITLPAAASNIGQIITIMKVDNDSQTVTIKGNGSDQIQSTGTLTMNGYTQTDQMQSVGSINGTGMWMPWGQGIQQTPAYLGERGGLTASAVATSSDVSHFAITTQVPVFVNGYRLNQGGTPSPAQYGIADMSGNILCHSASANTGSGVTTFAQPASCGLPPGQYLVFSQVVGTAATAGTINSSGTTMNGAARFATTTYPLTTSFTPGSAAITKAWAVEVIVAGGATF